MRIRTYTSNVKIQWKGSLARVSPDRRRPLFVERIREFSEAIPQADLGGFLQAVLPVESVQNIQQNAAFIGTYGTNPQEHSIVVLGAGTTADYDHLRLYSSRGAWHKHLKQFLVDLEKKGGKLSNGPLPIWKRWFHSAFKVREVEVSTVHGENIERMGFWRLFLKSSPSYFAIVIRPGFDIARDLYKQTLTFSLIVEYINVFLLVLVAASAYNLIVAACKWYRSGENIYEVR